MRRWSMKRFADIAELCAFRARCAARMMDYVRPLPFHKELPSGAEILCHDSLAELIRMQTVEVIKA